MNKIFSFFFFLGCLFGYGQKDSIMIQLDSSFKPGVYLKYSDFRHNEPIPIDSISCKEKNDSKDIYTKFKNNKWITVIRKSVKSTVHVNTFWGYYESKKLHIYFDGNFMPVSYPGAICLFIAMTNQMNVPYGSSTNFTTSRVAAPFFINFYNGLVLKGTPRNLIRLLKIEPRLQKEYRSLSRNEKLGKIKEFVGRFNQLHPIYFLK